MVLEITLGPNLRALLPGELPPNLAEGSHPQVPDFVPEEWQEQTLPVLRHSATMRESAKPLE